MPAPAHRLGPILSHAGLPDGVANVVFGLFAGICAARLKPAHHFRADAQAGMITGNLPTAGVDGQVSFGGARGSRFGLREQGHHAAECCTTVKTAWLMA